MTATLIHVPVSVPTNYVTFAVGGPWPTYESTCVIMRRYRVHRGVCLAATLLSQGHRWRIGVSRLPQTCSALFLVHGSGVEISQFVRLALPNDCDVAELKIY